VISSASEIVTLDQEQSIQLELLGKVCSAARLLELAVIWGGSARQLLGYTWLSNLFGIPGEFAYLDLTGTWNRAQHHRLQNPMSICVIDE